MKLPSGVGRVWSKRQFFLLLLLLFTLRVYYGLSQSFIFSDPQGSDDLQSYLIGLKYFTTGLWPFFGPDSYVPEKGGFLGQVPGALEGLMAGLPFHVLPIPEAPILAINVLSLAAIGALAWYASRRLTRLSFPFTFLWLALLPWYLHMSTHVYNIAYVLPGSIVFFIGFLESIPTLAQGLLGPGSAFACMGFGVLWCMQFHFSWVLLPPFVLYAFLQRRLAKQPGIPREILGFLGGAALPAAVLVPTLVRYGLSQKGMSDLILRFNPGNFKSLFTVVLPRYLSLPCFEIPRLVGVNLIDRKNFFRPALWLLPPALFLTAVGLVQPLVLLFYGALKKPKDYRVFWLRQAVLAASLWIWFNFWFTFKDPATRMYFVVSPLVMVYALHVWDRLAEYRWVRILGVACVVVNVFFETGYAYRMMNVRSIWLGRDKIVAAIDHKDYRLLAERRKNSWY